MREQWRAIGTIDCAVSNALELSGVVYTTILNPFDPRKNWPNLLTAYLLALEDVDATLVIKLVVPRRAPPWVSIPFLVSTGAWRWRIAASWCS